MARLADEATLSLRGRRAPVAALETCRGEVRRPVDEAAVPTFHGLLLIGVTDRSKVILAHADRTSSAESRRTSSQGARPEKATSPDARDP
jgi:hypothetical protein